MDSDIGGRIGPRSFSSLYEFRGGLERVELGASQRNLLLNASYRFMATAMMD